MNLETAAKFINADVRDLSPALLSAEVNDFSIDSRSVGAGDLFFALAQPDYKNHGFNGDFDDAHQFVPDAFAQGAVAAVVRADKLAEHDFLKKFQDRLLVVEDSILALQNLASAIYQNWKKPVVAITGSAGKTTAKELAAHVLAASGRRILSNIKNYNNGLGHPLTVLRLETEGGFDAAVLEMGMSTPMNEIQRLCQITPPDVAVVLTVLPVHLEHLGSIEAIAAAKAEIVENANPNGTAILNADADFFDFLRERAKTARVMTYGIEKAADVTASEIESSSFGQIHFRLNTPSGAAKVKMQLVGKHNVSNALAAAAVGLCFDMKPQEIADALSTIAPPPMRGEVLSFTEGFEVINDCYNSNPAALLEMVKTLVENGAHARRKIVIAGEMLELGADEENIHFETGKQIAARNVDALYGVRNLAKNLVAGAKENGLSDVRFFENSDEAAAEIVNLVKTGDLILVKGSRGVRTEKIVEGLLAKFSQTD